MISTSDVNSSSPELLPVSSDQTVSQSRQLIRRLGWLLAPAQLSAVAGKEFGRKIQESVKELARSGGVRLLQVRHRDAAVVMSLEHYNEMLRMKALCTGMVERLKLLEIAEEADQFESLYQRITNSRQGADALFSASDADINSAYLPGETETS